MVWNFDCDMNLKVGDCLIGHDRENLATYRYPFARVFFTQRKRDTPSLLNCFGINVSISIRLVWVFIHSSKQNRCLTCYMFLLSDGLSLWFTLFLHLDDIQEGQKLRTGRAIWYVLLPQQISDWNLPCLSILDYTGWCMGLVRNREYLHFQSSWFHFVTCSHVSVVHCTLSI